MLNVTIQQLGDASVLHCTGRILVGNSYSVLRRAVRSQWRARMLVLDLAQIDRIDAGGLGMLLSEREWARSCAIRFTLMNVTENVEQIFALTNLHRVFEFCSVRDLLCLLYCAASTKSRHNPILSDSRLMEQKNEVTVGQDYRRAEYLGVPSFT